MSRLVEALDAACPGFVPDPADVGLPYIWMGDFVRHLTRARLDGREEEMAAVFAVIETVIADDGPEAELAIIGFLEDLQNGNLHPEGSKPADFRPYLGPETLKQWDALNGFWGAVEDWKGR